jgi:hypothetical protein
VGCGDEEFPLFSAEPEPVVWTLLFKLAVKNEVWKDVGEKLDRHGKLYVIQSNADIAPT